MAADLVLIEPRANHRFVRPRAEGFSQAVEATRQHEHPEAALAERVECEGEHVPNEAEQQLILLAKVVGYQARGHLEDVGEGKGDRV